MMQFARGAFVALLIISFPACKFRAVTPQEANLLMERGAFPSSVPGWVNQTKLKRPRSSSNGIAARDFGAHAALEASRASIPNSVVNADRAVQQILKNAEEPTADSRIGELAKRKKEKSKSKEDSPLSRVSALCPHLEHDVNKALLETSVDERIKLYEILSRRCPRSEDLWVWLGEDYMRIAEYSDAKRCFERALVSNPSNEKVRKLLSEAKVKSKKSKY